jgi:plasmid stabilization system protein ParE
MKAVELAAEAVAEAIGAAIWYDDRRPGLGDRFLTELDATLSRVAEAPTSFPRLLDVPPELGVRRVLMRRSPYGLIFVELDTTVRVIAVAHLKRRPGYWLSRVAHD